MARAGSGAKGSSGRGAGAKKPASRGRATTGQATKAKPGGKGGKTRRKAQANRRTKRDEAAGRWILAAVLLIGGLTALRLGVNALDLIPVHFDEAQYWAYGQELAWGYFSKPPLVGAVIRITTDFGGDTLFWLRFGAPVAHAIIAVGLFVLGRRLFDAATGFWAAAAYALAPGVSVSSMIMSTDPVMMAFWVLALLFWLRAAEGGGATDWALMGVMIGLGALAKYTMLVLPVGALGYALLSARGRDWRGTGIVVAAALVVLGPNLLWNLDNSFATVTHVAEDADPGDGYLNPLKFLEFLGAQFGVIGPVLFPAILAAFWFRGTWREDWRMRLLAWQTGTLLFAMLALAFVTRAQPNWAAPAYVAGSLFAVRFLMGLGAARLLRWQLGLGAMAAVTVYAAAALYAGRSETLLRGPDPFKKMRLAEPFCDPALAAMAEEGAEVLLSNDRRRLSECMFQGGIGWDEVAVWNPKISAQNHHELVATLMPGDARPMLLAVLRGVGDIPAAFEEARPIDTGSFATHRDRSYNYELWFVRGFRGYPASEERG
ncbi:MAG: glycosyltransferase family 39 protein [Pseudomonadota bacterium]